jgi:hypothetical protein
LGAVFFGSGITSLARYEPAPQRKRCGSGVTSLRDMNLAETA